MRFVNDVLSVICVLRTNKPFLTINGTYLVMLHIRDVMPLAIAALSSAYEEDQDLHWRPLFSCCYSPCRISTWTMSSSLKPDRATMVAFTACDTTSSFLGIGVKTAQTLLKHYLLFPMTPDSRQSTPSIWHTFNAGVLLCTATAVHAQGIMIADVKLFPHGSRTIDHILHTIPAHGLYLATCKATTPICSRRFSLGMQVLSAKVLAQLCTVLDDASKAYAFLHHCGCAKAANVPEQVSNAPCFVTVDASTTMDCI